MTGQPPEAAGEPTRPALRLVRGEPQPEELAALLAVLSARTAGGGGDGRAQAPRRGRWGDPSAAVRRAPRPGPGAWRASGRLS